MSAPPKSAAANAVAAIRARAAANRASLAQAPAPGPAQAPAPGPAPAPAPPPSPGPAPSPAPSPAPAPIGAAQATGPGPGAHADQVDAHFFECPHCGATIEVPRGALNCQIFRHGALKIMEPCPGGFAAVPISPHATREECERLLSQDLIFGCGGAFRFDGHRAVECDYI